MTDGFPWAQSTTYRKNFMCDYYAEKINAEDYVYSAYRNTADYAMKLPSDSPLEYRMREMTQLNFHWFMQTLLEDKDIKEKRYYRLNPVYIALLDFIFRKLIFIYCINIYICSERC